MISTSIEQSQHLFKLGLDRETADMWWIDDQLVAKSDKFDVPSNDEETTVHCAWSLSALLEVIPAMIVYPTWVDKRPTDVWFNLDKDCNSETKKQFYMCYYKSLDTHQLAKNTDPSHSSPIDAAYQMVCWLLEQGLIKKEDNDE